MKAILIFLVLGVLAVYARPSFTPFLGLEELATPSFRQGNLVRNSFEKKLPNDRFVRLAYEAELEEGILALHERDQIVDVECYSTRITLHFENEDLAEEELSYISQTKLVTGGREWNCKTDSQFSAFYRRITAHLRIMNTIVLETEDARFEDFIKTGSITFNTNVAPRSAFRPSMDSSSMISKKGLNPIGFLKKVWTTAINFGDEIEHAVAKYIKEVEEIAEGNLDINEHWPVDKFGWNTDGSPVSIDDIISCTNCYLKFGVVLDLKLDLKEYSVDMMQIMSTLSVDARAELGLLGEEYSNSHEINVGTVESAPITFAIGPVPFILQFKVPVNLGYSIESKIGSVASVMAEVHSSTGFGVKYENGVMSVLQSGDTKYDGERKGFHVPKGHAQVMGYISAPATLVIDFLGSVYAGLKPFVSVNAGNEDASCDGLSVALNAGFQVGVGAQVCLKVGGKKILDKKLYAKTVYNMQVPISSDCIDGSDDDGQAVTTEGSTWYGFQSNPQTAGCEDYPSADVSYQLIRNDTEGVFFYGVINGWLSEAGGCMLQTIFRAQIDGNSITLSPDGTDDDTFSSCENPDIILVPVAVKGTITDDWADIVMTTEDNCISVQLHKSVQN